MIGTVDKYKALDHWLASCKTCEQVDVLVNIAYTVLVKHDGAHHEFNLIKEDAELKRRELLGNESFMFNDNMK